LLHGLREERLDVLEVTDRYPFSITGSIGNDVIRSTDDPDVIAGLGGNDVFASWSHWLVTSDLSTAPHSRDTERPLTFQRRMAVGRMVEV
jgi:hypothetical protein